MRLTRDLVSYSLGLSLGSYEVFFGGGRQTVLTFCMGLLTLPLWARYDERRRERDRDDEQ